MDIRKSCAVITTGLLLLLGGCAAPSSAREESSPEIIQENNMKPPEDGQTDVEVSSYGAQDNSSQDYQEFFLTEAVHDIYIEMEAGDWQAILDAPEAKEYYPADVVIDQRPVKNVGVRTRGNSSLRAARRHASERFPFRLKFDKYEDDQTFLGLDELVLNNGNDDPSFLREYFGYEVFRRLGVDVPYVSFFRVYVNGELQGLYTGVEAVDNGYLDRVFGSHHGNLYKAEVGATLEKDMDLDLLEQKKGDDTDKADLQELIQILDDMEAGDKGDIEQILDVESVLKYFAANAVLHNWDDYAGQFAHNYYLYMDNGQFHMLPWDINEGFLQTQAYYRESDGARQDISTPVTGEAVLEERPLVEKLLSVPEYYGLYLQYCEALCKWLGDEAAGQIMQLKEQIEDAVQQDSAKFFSFDDFERQFSEENPNGLIGFVGERYEYLTEALNGLTETDFQRQ